LVPEFGADISRAACSEACSLTSIGLLHLRLPSLVGLISLENAASRRVLEKLNYALECCAMHHDGEIVLYRLWPSMILVGRSDSRFTDRSDPPSCIERVRGVSD